MNQSRYHTEPFLHRMCKHRRHRRAQSARVATSRTIRIHDCFLKHAHRHTYHWFTHTGFCVSLQYSKRVGWTLVNCKVLPQPNTSAAQNKFRGSRDSDGCRIGSECYKHPHGVNPGAMFLSSIWRSECTGTRHSWMDWTSYYWLKLKVAIDVRRSHDAALVWWRSELRTFIRIRIKYRLGPWNTYIKWETVDPVWFQPKINYVLAIIYTTRSITRELPNSEICSHCKRMSMTGSHLHATWTPIASFTELCVLTTVSSWASIATCGYVVARRRPLDRK